MPSRLGVTPEGAGTGGSGGPPPHPEDDAQFRGVALRSQGLLTLAVGFAMGMAFMLFFWLIRTYGTPTGAVRDFVTQLNPNLGLSFLLGFLGGTLLAAVYNLLVVRRVNLFGLESSVD
ncbi:MAG: hypothetical protein ACREOO_03130 [bacterium]